MKRKFKKEILKAMVDGDVSEGFEVIKDEIYDTSRWSSQHTLIFKHEGLFWDVDYSRGLTEQQMEDPFEYGPDEIECIQVEPVDVTVTEYRQV